MSTERGGGPAGCRHYTGSLAGGFFFVGEAVVADTAYFGAGDGDLHFEVAGDLFF